jgi:hypothetical protein
VKALSSNPKTARKMEKRGQGRGGEGTGEEERRGEEKRKEIWGKK